MGDAWYDDMKSDEDKLYEEAVMKIKKAVEQQLSFDQAAALVDVADEGMKAAIIDDALKVLIAERHFMGQTSLKDLSSQLKVSAERLMKARAEMLKDVEAAAIQKYKEEQGQQGNA